MTELLLERALDEVLRRRDELGAAGLDEYRETKHVWHNIRPAEQRWFQG